MSPRTLPVHAPVEAFPVSDNCLVVGGAKLTQLAEQIGRTPFYVYDSAFIAKRLRTLRDAIPDADMPTKGVAPDAKHQTSAAIILLKVRDRSTESGRPVSMIMTVSPIDRRS